MINLNPPIVVGIAGGTCSGKKEVSKMIAENLSKINSTRVQRISLANFYRQWSSEEVELIKKHKFNFDHPDAIDYPLLIDTLTRIKEGQRVEIPEYDLVTRTRVKTSSQVIDTADVVIIEGSLLFYAGNIRDFLNIKIFIDEDSDVRLSKRVLNDTENLGRSIEKVLQEYLRFVKPSFEEFTLPTKKTADLIVPKASTNHLATDMIVRHVINLRNNKTQLRKSDFFPDTLFYSTPFLATDPERNSKYEVIRN